MSDANAFTGADLDRAGDGRRADSEWIERQRRDPGALALTLGDAGLRVADEALAREPLASFDRDAPDPVLLGIEAGTPLWAVDVDAPAAEPRRPVLIGAGGRRGEPMPELPGWIALREAAGRLPQPEAGLAAYAAALLNWHRAHRFCANCGAPTGLTEGGGARACPRCASTHHPRTDPVVIMLVSGPAGLLLGRQPSWPERRYSALAGFVSPGESLEEAVVREVGEEAGVEVGEPRYVSSQPWPFPASLMVGFEVSWRAGEPGGADAELEDVRWFGRDEVAEAATRDEEWEGAAGDAALQLPPRTAIARRLIEGWLAR